MGTIDSEQVFLKWNNFENNLASGFVDLLQQEAMVDVTLAVEGRLVQAHKVVLSICSSYFRNMFQLNPCQHPIVILKDVGYQELTDMLDFMYRGEANVKQQDLPSFLKLAETLKVKGLAGGSSETPVERHQTDQDNRKESPVNAKHGGAGEVKGGCRDVNFSRKGCPNILKKRKRSVSPMKALDFKINCRNDKYDNMEACDEDRRKKYSYMNDIECVNIKEERLSDASFDSYGDEVCENETPENRMLPGPSRLDEPSENIRKGDDMAENDLPENNRLLPGPSRADELCETVPQESMISRRASKPLSLIWSFFNFDCHENKSECKLCGKVFKACPKTGTASVKYHLHFAHQILRNEGECAKDWEANRRVVSQRSPIWKFFDFEGRTVTCKLCLLRMKGVKCSSAERHIRLKHQTTYKAFRQEKLRWLRMKSLFGYIRTYRKD